MIKESIRKEVVCALISDKGRLLVTQHGMHAGHPWKWEFPGGKIQPGESREEALVREIREELEIGIAVGSPLEPVSHAYAGKEIILYPFLCRWTEGELILREHHAALWVSPEETAGMDMLEADRKMLTTGQNMARLKLFACS